MAEFHSKAPFRCAALFEQRTLFQTKLDGAEVISAPSDCESESERETRAVGVRYQEC